jgi:hypothetical protein
MAWSSRHFRFVQLTLTIDSWPLRLRDRDDGRS